MSWGEVELEPEVVDWYRNLTETEQSRVRFHVDRLAELGPLLEAGLTQAELAERMGTTQSAIARMEAGGTRPTLETLERLATAIGQELIVGVGTELSRNRSIAKLVRQGHAVVRKAS